MENGRPHVRAGDSRPGCWRESSSFGLLLSGCSAGGESSGSVSESTAGSSSESAADSVSTLLEITDPEEKAAVEAAKGKVAAMDGEARIIATSPATAEICDRLDLDLVGVCLQHDFGAAGALFGSDHRWEPPWLPIWRSWLPWIRTGS